MHESHMCGEISGREYFHWLDAAYEAEEITYEQYSEVLIKLYRCGMMSHDELFGSGIRLPKLGNLTKPAPD